MKQLGAEGSDFKSKGKPKDADKDKDEESEGASSADASNDTTLTNPCDAEADKNGGSSKDGDKAIKDGDKAIKGKSVKPNGGSGKILKGNWTYDEIPEKYKKHIKIPRFDTSYLDHPDNNFILTGNTGQCTELTWAYMRQLHGEGQPTDDGQVTNGQRVYQAYEKLGAKTTNNPTVGYGFSSTPPYALAAVPGVGHTGIVAGVMDDGKFIIAQYNVSPDPAPSRTVLYSVIDGVPKDAGNKLIFFSGIKNSKKKSK
ncbi:TPA_asm: CHAP domain-containing protein [Listeria monocytogenes]|nr:CHAP domain-containing protein [Listeria monocytogenes]